MTGRHALIGPSRFTWRRSWDFRVHAFPATAGEVDTVHDVYAIGACEHIAMPTTLAEPADYDRRCSVCARVVGLPDPPQSPAASPQPERPPRPHPPAQAQADDGDRTTPSRGEPQYERPTRSPGRSARTDDTAGQRQGPRGVPGPVRPAGGRRRLDGDRLTRIQVAPAGAGGGHHPLGAR